MFDETDLAEDERIRHVLGDSTVRRYGGPAFGDTLCWTCGRLAVPGDLGADGCEECAEHEALFASYTGRTALRRADEPSLPRPLANLVAVELLVAAFRRLP